MRRGISTTIHENRERVGMSQQELAHMLGVSRSLISNWERGGLLPNHDMTRDLSAILGVDLPTATGEFGLRAWLRGERERRGLSRGELAKRAGVSPLTIYYIETGQTESPQESTVNRLQKVLGRMPRRVTRQVEAGRIVEDFEFRGPFPVSEWKENLGDGSISCVYVFYDKLKRPVRIGETDDLGRRLKEYEQNYWWFRLPTVESFAYVRIDDPEYRRKTEKVMIKLLGSNAVFNTQGKVF